ncbi:3-hydroxyacyl-CoA dehydrogenase NAD-binding domain-containing protein [Micromonospora sp. NPDC004540]|uniref:3-hydroxyacyl-CoA dehydrogenase NAD-binding domain-containing protein n=1 Tax=Micromonospora sp. NPDC004540 TaxID=3154457 RepID=UPI0033BF1CC1
MGAVTVVGTGTIGLGWIALFAAHGLPVRVNSRRPDADRVVWAALEMFAPALPGAPDPVALHDSITFEPDLARAVADADVVSENAPDDLELKQELFAAVEESGSRALLLSSTSKLVPDDLGARMKDPGRLVVAHPFNPPHLVPLVEVVAGVATDAAAVDEAMAFLRSVGRHPVLLRRALPAFAANRLQSALLRECIHLVVEGVVTVPELDEVVTHSIGLRWATMGPFQAFHLGGGEGGLRRWLSHLGSGLEQGWRQLGTPAMTDETRELLVTQTEQAYGDRTYAGLVAERDRLHLTVLDALARARAEPS